MELNINKGSYVDDSAVTYRLVTKSKPYTSIDKSALFRLYGTTYVPGSCAFDLVEYRPNLSKKGRVLWKLTSVLYEDLISFNAGDGGYSGRYNVVGRAIQDESHPAYQEALRYHERRWKDTKPGVMCEEMLVRIEKHSHYGRSAGSPVCVSCHETFYVPTHKELTDKIGGDARIAYDHYGLHNKEFLNDSLSEHERLRVMLTLKAKGWSTKK